jgi:uncharacterized protein YbjT (DUF2867 family)
MSKIAVAGATGRVGIHIVDLLEADGHEVVQIARSKGVDVITGAGLAEALEGVECIIDATTPPTPDEQAAIEFFTTAARNLQEQGHRAGVRRIVLVSIVGVDRFQGGYNAAKVMQEQTHLVGPIPVRILRATQFHEFVEQLMDWGRQGDVAYVWRMRTQLVAARTVAEALVELATENKPVPATGEGPIWEIAGPREERLVEAARRLAARNGDPVRVEEVDAPDPLFETGGSLPGPDAALCGPTFDEWMESHVIA